MPSFSSSSIMNTIANTLTAASQYGSRSSSASGLSYNRDYKALYLNTGGSSSLSDYVTGAKFGSTMAPSVLSNNKIDEDIMILMNDGIEFYQDPWQNFDRLYSVYMNHDEVDTRQYVFFVRPQMYIVDATGSDSRGTVFELSKTSRTYYDGLFRYMMANHEVILRSLTEEFGRAKLDASPVAASGIGTSGYGGQESINGQSLTMHAWIPWLVGRTESLQIPDYTIKQFNLVQPYTKYSMPYVTSAIESQSGGTFDVTFREDSLLRVHKFFHTWLYYMDGVSRNKFRPKDKFLMYNAFDYMSSVYHIVCDATAQNIIWFSKYTGVVPTSVPNSDLSWNRGGKTENTVTVSFAYFHHEALNPRILTDFNYNSLGYNYCRGRSQIKVTGIPLYDVDHGIMGTNLVGRPVIVSSGPEGFLPKLRWLPPSSLSQLIDR